MKRYPSRYFFGMLLADVLLLPSFLCAQQSLSHVRVVRLSYLNGTVAIQRPGSTEWAQAIVNTPIQEGFGLETSDHSFAEVQFENGSTVRLGELSKLGFSQLAMDSQGNKLNRLLFEQGYATFHVIPEHGDVYTVSADGATLTPKGKSKFRTDFDQDRLRVEVFDGAVDAASSSGSARLGKDKVLEFDPQTTAAFNVQRGIEKDAWDKWTEARDTQSQLTVNDQAVGLNRPMYGWDDLNEYGEWAYVPGFGYGWSPYEATGWMPYSMGLWNWYPSFGWTWIAGEPWGWLPYHYGLWNFDSSLGWFWMPGNFGAWSPGLVNWSSGPGWIGWSPYGATLPPGYNGVVSVPGSTVQNGGAINSGTVTRRPTGQGLRMARPDFPPGRQAMLSGVPLAKGVTLPGSVGMVRAAAIGRSSQALAQVTPGSPASLVGTAITSRGTARGSVAAPTTVLMGGDPAAERATLENHTGFWQRFLGAGQQPLHMRLGPTLGGHLPVSGFASHSPEALGGVHEFAGSRDMMGARAPIFSRMFGSGGFVVPHGAATAAARGSDGGFASAGRGGMGTSSSGLSSSASSMASASHGGGPSGGGGGHH